MKIDNSQVLREQQERIRLGQIVREGKESAFWLEIVKPTIESLLVGASDITSIDISSDKKASIEVSARKMLVKGYQEIETLIDGFVIDADTVLNIAEKKKTTPLYKKIN